MILEKVFRSCLKRELSAEGELIIVDSTNVFIVKFVFPEIKIQFGSSGTIIKRGGGNNLLAISPRQLSELKYWSWGGKINLEVSNKCPRHMLRGK